MKEKQEQHTQWVNRACLTGVASKLNMSPYSELIRQATPHCWRYRWRLAPWTWKRARPPHGEVLLKDLGVGTNGSHRDLIRACGRDLLLRCQMLLEVLAILHAPWLRPALIWWRGWWFGWKVSCLKEICPRGNNKVVIYISLYHDKYLLFILELYRKLSTCVNT